MAGSAPYYDNQKWGGPQGVRIPQEVFPATMAVVKETDINVGGAGSTNTITIDPSQTLSSYYTLTNAGSGATTINFPVLHNGFVFTVYNNSGQSSIWKVTGKTGVTVANGYKAVLLFDKVAADIVRVTPDQSGTGTLTTPNVTVYTGTTDAIAFPNAYNVAIITSTGPEAATLATPVAGDNGKTLVIINTNTTQSTVTTAANKILNGTGTAGDTLTAPAHAGAVVVLYAAALFWNIAPAGTGTWVLSEV